VRRITVVSLVMPFDLPDDQALAAYNDWLEARILGPMRATEPERYRAVVGYVRQFIVNLSDSDDD
jgi:hypothetical protein